MAAVLQEGNNILIAHRRLFEKDEPRFFIGRVDAYDTGVVKVTGRSFVRDMATGGFLPKSDDRTKIVSLASGLVIVYQLPDSVKLASLQFQSDEGQIVLTDGAGYEMNLTERPHRGEI